MHCPDVYKQVTITMSTSLQGVLLYNYLLFFQLFTSPTNTSGAKTDSQAFSYRGRFTLLDVNINKTKKISIRVINQQIAIYNAFFVYYTRYGVPC